MTIQNKYPNNVHKFKKQVVFQFLDDYLVLSEWDYKGYSPAEKKSDQKLLERIADLFEVSKNGADQLITEWIQKNS